MKRKKAIVVTINEEDRIKYRLLCEKYSYNMTKRIRNFIIQDIKLMENEKK